MNKTWLKFALSLDFIIITIGFYFFFEEYVSFFNKFIFPIIFLYFIIDSLSVLIPGFYNYIPSTKHFSTNYIENTKYDKADYMNDWDQFLQWRQENE